MSVNTRQRGELVPPFERLAEARRRVEALVPWSPAWDAAMAALEEIELELSRSGEFGRRWEPAQ